MALNVKLVLDTCAVRNRDLLDWLARRTSGDVCISAVVYMELCRQTLARGNTIDGLRKLIDKHHIKILPFDKHTAEIAAEYMTDAARFPTRHLVCINSTIGSRMYASRKLTKKGSNTPYSALMLVGVLLIRHAWRM